MSAVRAVSKDVTLRRALRAVSPLALSAVLVGFGIGVLFLVLHFHTGTGDAVVIALLAPIVVYTIVSGRLNELSAGGVFQATFRAARTQPLAVAAAAANNQVQADHALALTAKDDTEELESYLEGFNPDELAVLTVEIGLGKEYCQRTTMLKTAEMASEVMRKLRYVVFLKGERVIGYMALWAFEQCLREEKHGRAFTEAINSGAADILSQARGFLTITLRPDEANLDALREMQTHHLEALVVADADGRLKGIVEREAAVSHLLLALVST